MKKLCCQKRLIALLTLSGLLFISAGLRAQKTENIQKQLRNLKISIPFIDRDGDGINDLLQNGWGLKFLEQYRNLRAIWDQINVEGKDEGQLVDTDNDGVPDKPFREFMMQKMNQPVDTDGDGVVDTPLQEHLAKRFQSFDDDGDGIPDPLTPQQIQQYMEEMRMWREAVKEQVLRGQDVFGEESVDGVLKSIPANFGIARRFRGK